MAIPVRIEAKAWTDPRYQALALELGMARARHALIAVADIWQWQTEHYSDDQPTYCVPRAVIVGALEHRDGPEAMVAAGLAEAMGDGTFRIRGGMDDRGKSRIDWLHRDRMAQAERGRRRADRAATEGRQGGKFTSREPAGHQPEGVQTPAANQPATSSPDSGLRTKNSDLSRTTRARGDAGGSYDPQADADAGDVSEPLGVLGEHAVARLNAARSKIDPTARAIHPMSAANGGDGARLRQRLREVAPASERRSVLDHVLDVVIATAEDERSVAKLSLVYISGEQAWPSLRDATLASIAARRGPRDRDRSPAQARPGRVDANSRLDEQLDRVQRLRDAEAAEGSPS